jgi:hypothetical protein
MTDGNKYLNNKESIQQANINNAIFIQQTVEEMKIYV